MIPKFINRPFLSTYIIPSMLQIGILRGFSMGLTCLVSESILPRSNSNLLTSLSSYLDPGSLPPITYDHVQIPVRDTVRNLGAIFNKCLTWKPKVAEVNSRVFAAYMSLRHLGNFLPISMNVSLAQSLFLAFMDYAYACYLDLSERLLSNLVRL